MQTLPSADMCILKPHACHHHKGTCRDPQWGLDNCFQPHTLYLARSSSIKIGITRGTVPFGRWMDQGAIEGMAIGSFQIDAKSVSLNTLFQRRCQIKQTGARC